MRRLLRLRPSPAMVVALISLFVALGGVGYAAATIGSAQIKNNSVRGKDIRNRTIASKDVKKDGLGGASINESALGRVPDAAHADNADAAKNATTANSATTADTAATATSADSIASNTVRSANVVDGSLNGDDVGRASGSATKDVDNVLAGTCETELLDTGTAVDMRDDAIVVTAEEDWPTGVSFSVENSNTVGLIRLNICNPTAGDIDPPSMVYHWVAFDVVP